MYADRYAGRRGLNPGGVAFALGASGFLLFGLSLTAPHFTQIIDKPFTGINIPLPTDPPPPQKAKPQPPAKLVKTVPTQPIDKVEFTPPVTLPTDSGMIDSHVDAPPVDTVVAGTGTEIGTVLPPPHVPVLFGPQLDARFTAGFQPGYPADERLAGREGRVTVRVLIGPDGRVKDVQQVSAASPAFFEATRRQALAKWRFRPGTRDGVAIDAWYTLSVRFVLDEV